MRRIVLLLSLFAIALQACKMNQLSTTSSSTLINFDEPAIYTDFFTIYKQGKKHIRILVEIAPNFYSKSNSNDSLYTFELTLELVSQSDSLLEAKKDEFTLPISKKSTIFEYVFPMEQQEISYRLQVRSPSLYEDRIYVVDTKVKSTKVEGIGAIEPGYKNIDGFFTPFVKYVQQENSSAELQARITYQTTQIDSLSLFVYSVLTDNELARPLHARQYSNTSLSFRGIDYSKNQLIYEFPIPTNEYSGVTIVTLPDLKEGNYAFVLKKWNSKEVISEKNIVFVDERFPNYSSIFKQLEPFQYILPESEYQSIRTEANPDSAEKKFIQYFVNHIGSKSKIREVLSMYSKRVSEANFFFTNYKEGWKTDMGMMYIIYGPPFFVTRRYNSIFWHYTHDPNDPLRVFEFRRVRLNSIYFPFDHYLVKRSSSYFTINYSRINDWRTGAILKYPQF